MLQMMVLLSGALRNSPDAGKVQALEGWLLLLKALAQHAPTHLAGMANQVCQNPTRVHSSGACISFVHIHSQSKWISARNWMGTADCHRTHLCIKKLNETVKQCGYKTLSVFLHCQLNASCRCSSCHKAATLHTLCCKNAGQAQQRSACVFASDWQ